MTKLSNLLSNNLPNLILRSLAILGKFFLVMYIAKKMTLEDLGTYNLLAVTVAIFLFIVGFEFHSYTGRQYKNSRNHSFILLNQFLSHLILYVIIIPISYLLFIKRMIDNEYVVILYLIIIFDHLSQEISRVFVYIGKSIIYNFLFFIKNGAWVFPLIIQAVFFEETFVVKEILEYWLIGAIISFIIGLYYLYKQDVLRYANIDVKWIFAGYKIAAPFFLMSISLRIIEFSDRYFIEYYLDLKQLGIYSFYFGIASIATTLTTSSIGVQYIPLFLDAENNIKRLVPHIRSFTLKILILYATIIPGILIFFPPLIKYMDKTDLLDNYNMIWFMIINSILMSLSIVPQNILYALNRDLVLMFTSVLGAILNVCINILLLNSIGLYAAVFSTTCTYLLINIIRIYYLKNKCIWKSI